ncbi:3'-5' exoribonuclease 1-like [Penaeus japonicus]|uniref:3'-5' exoribonuclease 1-like n=1 Tax=Penaeus japonicus TaxID=27405 RepID=UPI001C715BE6|nr:3'-5' exoribonuclease 1-like [Penaeus japonicus]XP_042856504.1 3'-5' exoribonuclease 1-like [Penaeus japonicus]
MNARNKPRGSEESKETKKTPTLNFTDSQLIASGGGRNRNVFSALADSSFDMIDVDIGEGGDGKDDYIEEEPSSDKKEKSGHDNPVFRELAVINGKINRMSNDELRQKLRNLRLDQRGSKEVRKNRLKAYYRTEKLEEAYKEDPQIELYKYFDYYVVIDFEATCDAGNSQTYRHEIIEFPAMLVDTSKSKIIAEFHSYVRPTINQKLTEFCTCLTGITQDHVNYAPEFPEVLKNFEKWLAEHNLIQHSGRFAVVTDGPWDMGRFMYLQCKISNLPFPKWCKQWINIRKTYSNFYNSKRICLKDMLSTLGMRFEGKPHCGRDDAYNIARIAMRLLRDGANMRLNEEISTKERYCDIPGMTMVKNITRQSFLARRITSPGKTSGTDTNKKMDSENEDSQMITDSDSSKNLAPVWGIDHMNVDEFPDLMRKNS